MAYNMTKEELVKNLLENAVYFPFEQIRSYMVLKKYPTDADIEKDYLEFFADVKRECERLLQTDLSNDNRPLWQEALDEIGKILI